MLRHLEAKGIRLVKLLPIGDQQLFFAYFAIGMAFAGGVITALTSPFPMVVKTASVGSCCWAVLILGLYRGLTIAATCHIATVIATIEIFIGAWYSGAIYSSSLTWMAVLVTANYFIVSTRAAVSCLIICIASLALIAHPGQLLGITPDIQRASLEGSVVSLLDNSLVFIVIMLVTFFYRQSDLKALKELHARQRDLQTQRTDLERTLAARDQFIAKIQHEIKEPLGAIAEMSEALLADAEHTPDVCMVLEYSAASAVQISAAVANLLTYTRLQSGQLHVHLEPLSLPVELQATFAALQAQNKNPSIRCALEIDIALLAPLHSDKKLLALCLQNLLDNACRFTQSGHITLAARPGANGAVIISVEDSGAGMDPAEQSRLGHTLRDGAPALGKAHQNVGLGLLVAQGVVQLLGGTLGFESTQYRGSRFWIRLPLQSAAQLGGAR